jgi:hypothetical protein
MPKPEHALAILDMYRASNLPIDPHTQKYIRDIIYRTQAYTTLNPNQRQWLLDNRIVG